MKKYILIFILLTSLVACNAGESNSNPVSALQKKTFISQKELINLANKINDPELKSIVLNVVSITSYDHSDYLRSIATILKTKIAELNSSIELEKEVIEDKQKLDQFLNGEYEEEKHLFRISFNYYNHKSILLRDFSQERQKELQKGLAAQEQQIEEASALLEPLKEDLAILSQIIENFK